MTDFTGSNSVSVLRAGTFPVLFCTDGRTRCRGTRELLGMSCVNCHKLHKYCIRQLKPGFRAHGNVRRWREINSVRCMMGAVFPIA